MILHITNGFSRTSLFKNLFQKLDNIGVEQTVYNPIYKGSATGKNNIDFQTQNSQIIYSPILEKWLDRLFYSYKIKKTIHDIESKIDLSKVKLIHAHTWYSDGGAAYLLSKKHNIPYIIAVRNTDINLFFKYKIHLRKFGFSILKNAQSIILISEAYKKRILKLYSPKQTNQFRNKLEFIPNGVDSFWIKNAGSKQSSKKESNLVDILFIGNFSKGKKLLLLQQAIIELNSENRPSIKLHVVGERGKQEKEIKHLIQQYPNFFKYYGRINHKEQLQTIFQKCDFFAMPSRSETFGLVYIEAMLNGLPIMYTKNEGIDGVYPNTIGETVNKTADVEEIKQALLKMIQNLNSYDIPIEDIKKNHDWRNIAQKYLQLYI